MIQQCLAPGVMGICIGIVLGAIAMLLLVGIANLDAEQDEYQLREDWEPQKPAR